MRLLLRAACALALCGAPVSADWGSIDPAKVADEVGQAVEDAAEEAEHFGQGEEASEEAGSGAGDGEPGQYSELKQSAACPKITKRKTSDRCLAGNDRAVRVYFELPGVKGKRGRVFGVNDKKGIIGKFKKPPTQIVVHNGGSAKQNRDWWQGKRKGSHYTVDRDGKVYQHHGEEFRTIHANLNNDKAIGIELETLSVKIGKTSWHCNKMHKARLKGEKLRNPQDMDYVRRACAPTAAQYSSLKALVDDIARRQGITVDEKSVIGHCEAKGKVHGDPRAFDWDKIGVDKAKKNALFKTRASMRHNCWYYEP